MKKYIVTAGAISALVIAGSAFAQDGIRQNGDDGQGPRMPVQIKHSLANAAQVNISPMGEATIRGTVTAVNGNVLSVKSWGGEWMIRISDSTQFNTPKRWMQGTTTGTSTDTSTQINLVKFVVGDYIGVQGKVSADASWTIDAKYINNRMPVPMPKPMPWISGTSTIYCIKAPCPGVVEPREKMKELEKMMRENMKDSKKGERAESHVNVSSAGDAQTINRVREMISQQLKTSTNVQVQAQLQEALNRLNTTLGANVNASTTR